MYKIVYDYRYSIVRLLLSGTVTFETIEEISKELYGNTTNANLLLLTDAREAKYEFGIDDIANSIELTNKYIKHGRIIHEAILLDSSKEVAISTMFDIKNSRKEKHIFKIFSTEIAAIDWLLIYKK